MDLFLKGKVAMVTGAGGGMAKVIATTFAAEGADIVVAELDEARAQGTVDACKALGVRAVPALGSVTDKAVVDEMVQKAAGELGKIDILVNAVGASMYTGTGAPGEFHTTTPQQWQQTLDFCFLAALNCTHAVLPGMIERKWGRVLNILSDAYKGRDKRMSLYGAAKAATNIWGKTMSMELGKYNITVNAVAPGATKTDTLAMVFDPQMADMKQKMMKSYPLAAGRGDLGMPEDIANMVVFLCSDRASWVTGQAISVSGGFS
ncbi:MAG: SDR family oxidoreductase [Chloroflexota bacterium]|nr:SDR family oxidoreductase [Chloroflexota bacterium]